MTEHQSYGCPLKSAFQKHIKDILKNKSIEYYSKKPWTNKTIKVLLFAGLWFDVNCTELCRSHLKNKHKKDIF